MYTLGNQDSVLNLLEQRRLDEEGKFILPYIKDNMNILDYGCGLSTILGGLHGKYPTVQVFGIDFDIDVLKKALKRKKISYKKAHTRFVLSNVLEIPFNSNSFDFAFGNSILMQLSDPTRAIQEINRTLRPDGIIAIREPDYSLDEYSYEGSLYNFWNLFCEMLILDGGNPYIGSKIENLLTTNGFYICESKLSKNDYKKFPTNIFLEFVNEATFINRAYDIGIINKEFLLGLGERIQLEMNNPKFYMKRAYYEIIARKKD